MYTTRSDKRLTEWEPCSSRPVGRPRLRWLRQVEEDLKKMKVRDWREKFVEPNRKAGQNPPRAVAPTEEEESKNSDFK